MIRNIKEFKKLNKIKIPIEEHFDYYIETLRKSKQFVKLNEIVENFKRYENDIDRDGKYPHVKSYFLDYALPKMSKFLKNSEAYKNLIKYDINSKSKTRTKNILNDNIGEMLLSIDFKSADYTTLKNFDTKGELSNSWEDLCESLDIHNVLASSKTFRQHCLGLTNPKRLRKIQRLNIIKIVDGLIKDGHLDEDDILSMQEDEFIVKISKCSKLYIESLCCVIESIMNDKDVDYDIHYKLYKETRITEGEKLHTVYNYNDGIEVFYNKLHNTSGNKYFRRFKEHIINEPLDKRDLMFKVEGEVCYWDIDVD